MDRYIAFDTETTGIVPGVDRIIEIAAIDFDPETGIPTGRYYHTFLNPQREIPAEVSAVHGKTLADLKDEPLFKDIVPDLLEYLEGATTVIHNAPFDVAHIDAELKLVRKGTMAKRTKAIIDTLSLSRRHTKAKKHDLDSLCDRFGVDRSKRTLHGAFVDCEMLAGVFPPLMRVVNQMVDAVNTVLPYPLGAPLCETLEENAERSLQLAAIIGVLTKERQRYLDVVKEQSEGLNIANELFTVEHTPGTKTDWERVKKELLAGVDLKPYQSATSTMHVKYV
ncbi:exonuclease domain-containing protein [Burkholderia cenocepacia]|uniref:exonuclease domain-containing protein n=1 Tax=Burkholderia cenocepacia TaxID=95486 RepID=UPI000760B8D9|nr:exonuclease domain-containing protein [Burkholderia cenocepacia]KWU24743.1 hypothetical protein AS149_31865 [Burkholderia cenocepacia]